MNREEVMKLAEEIIDNNPIAVVGTINGKYPNIKALQTMERDDLATFYFSTKEDSRKIKQMKKNKNGCIYYYDKEKYQTVLIEGSFSVEQNLKFGVGELYKLDQLDPYDFVTIVFKSKKLYVYTHRQTAEIIL